MIVYTDSSALIKRAIEEAESESLEDALRRYNESGDTMVASSIAGIEVSRALRRVSRDDWTEADIRGWVDIAMSGVAERPLASEVVALARRVGDRDLRTLDAIHLATALLLDPDVVITYDMRLAHACQVNGLTVSAPGV